MTTLAEALAAGPYLDPVAPVARPGARLRLTGEVLAPPCRVGRCRGVRPAPPVCDGGGLPLTAAVTAANVNDTSTFEAVPDDVPAVVCCNRL